MKRETESSPYRIYYNSPENFKLQFFSVKCFTYETENIDTHVIDIAGWGGGGYVRNCIALNALMIHNKQKCTAV